jgi:1,4-alpha-glucan branching enzyme
VVALNFTPVPREGYRIGVPRAGRYRELFNSDSTDYAGSGMGNAAGFLETQDIPWMNQGQSLTVTLPPLAGIVLQLQGEPALSAEPEAAGAQTGAGTLPSH